MPNAFAKGVSLPFGWACTDNSNPYMIFKSAFRVVSFKLSSLNLGLRLIQVDSNPFWEPDLTLTHRLWATGTVGMSWRSFSHSRAKTFADLAWHLSKIGELCMKPKRETWTFALHPVKKNGPIQKNCTEMP